MSTGDWLRVCIICVLGGMALGATIAVLLENRR